MTIEPTQHRLSAIGDEPGTGLEVSGKTSAATSEGAPVETKSATHSFIVVWGCPEPGSSSLARA